MPYGIYAYVRRKTGVPFVMVLTKGGSWCKDSMYMHHWATKGEVERLIPKVKAPPNSKNVWWFEVGNEDEV
jgi:hypothetical protein